MQRQLGGDAAHEVRKPWRPRWCLGSAYLEAVACPPAGALRTPPGDINGVSYLLRVVMDGMNIYEQGSDFNKTLNIINSIITFFYEE